MFDVAVIRNSTVVHQNNHILEKGIISSIMSINTLFQELNIVWLTNLCEVAVGGTFMTFSTPQLPRLRNGAPLFVIHSHHVRQWHHQSSPLLYMTQSVLLYMTLKVGCKWYSTVSIYGIYLSLVMVGGVYWSRDSNYARHAARVLGGNYTVAGRCE